MMHFTLSFGGTKWYIFFYSIASSCWTTGQNPWRELHYRRRRRFSGWNGEDMVYTSCIAMTVYRPLGAKGPRKRSSVKTRSFAVGSLSGDTARQQTNVPPNFAIFLIYCFYISNRPFAASDHVVQNPPCWRASSLLFSHWDIKTKRPEPVKLDLPLFWCPSAGIIMSLPSSMADFVPRDR